MSLPCGDMGAQKGKRGVGFLSLLALWASHWEARTTGY